MEPMITNKIARFTAQACLVVQADDPHERVLTYIRVGRRSARFGRIGSKIEHSLVRQRGTSHSIKYRVVGKPNTSDLRFKSNTDIGLLGLVDRGIISPDPLRDYMGMSIVRAVSLTPSARQVCEVLFTVKSRRVEPKDSGRHFYSLILLRDISQRRRRYSFVEFVETLNRDEVFGIVRRMLRLRGSDSIEIYWWWVHPTRDFRTVPSGSSVAVLEG